MTMIKPEVGLVISYSYLWHHEHRQGHEEGLKNRPCVIIRAASKTEDGASLIWVVPVTHLEPEDPAAAVEIPRAVKDHLGLDSERSWMILDELNEFTWPGYDLRPLPGTTKEFAYGLIPPGLYDVVRAKITALWKAGQLKRTNRD